MFVDAQRVASIGRQVAPPDGSVFNVGFSAQTLHTRQQSVVACVIGFDVAEYLGQRRLGRR
jgi:hypothetical protein